MGRLRRRWDLVRRRRVSEEWKSLRDSIAGVEIEHV
jgi:hypothetical protein